ncbi:unnamed protein product [Prorocentrum cordatum]|uniref:Uncharacterized protein n=1 Tax=Prorocentrum cordatum TaxID=2364126 RepID=A0ABN9PUA4_9DINO|nr:unnamed protein product [Polarella glacialis]
MAQARGAPSAAPVSRPALARLRRELAEVRRAGNPQIAVSPSEDCMLEWHFALHSLPADTPYHGGCYHGQLHFPPEYPHAPPSIVMVTPSGRLHTGQRLCLSMTDFHPESWNPAWSVETILVGLLSFFTSDAETGFGSVSAPDGVRRELAAASWSANARDPEFAALFPELLAPPSQARPVAPEPAASPREEGPPAAPSPRLAPTECWICRCDTAEPLVWPCACRGSMGGVHPSCVEHWLHCQRRAGRGGAERPRCLVCGARYAARRQVRPGLLAFARHHLVKAGGHLIHCSVVVGLLVGVQEFMSPAAEGAVLPRPVRAVAAAAFPVFCLHKLAVLLVSLPPHRAPPRRRTARQFFVSEPAELARHVAEALTVVIVTGFGCMCGALHWAVFAPLAAAAAGVVLSASEAPPLALAQAAAATAVRLVVVLVALTVQACRRVARRPRGVAEAMHPLGAGPHVVASLVTIPGQSQAFSAETLRWLLTATAVMTMVTLTAIGVLQTSGHDDRTASGQSTAIPGRQTEKTCGVPVGHAELAGAALFSKYFGAMVMEGNLLKNMPG